MRRMDKIANTSDAVNYLTAVAPNEKDNIELAAKGDKEAYRRLVSLAVFDESPTTLLAFTHLTAYGA